MNSKIYSSIYFNVCVKIIQYLLVSVKENNITIL